MYITQRETRESKRLFDKGGIKPIHEKQTKKVQTEYSVEEEAESCSRSCVSRADATVGAHVCYSWVGDVFLQAHVWSERVSSVCVYLCDRR